MKYTKELLLDEIETYRKKYNHLMLQSRFNSHAKELANFYVKTIVNLSKKYKQLNSNPKSRNEL